MRNHDQKTKTMQRSVLPSTGRNAARTERRRIHKAARTREHNALASFNAATGADDFDPDFGDGRRKSTTKWMVLDRRSRDKIGPLTRWAVRTVETDPRLRDAALHEQVAHFAALLPNDLIGAHAVFHIRWALQWAFHRDTTRWYSTRDAGPSRQERRDQVAADVRRLLEQGRHRELNTSLRRAYAAMAAVPVGRSARPADARLLEGLHDIEDFAVAVSAHPWICELITDLDKARS